MLDSTLSPVSKTPSVSPIDAVQNKRKNPKASDTVSLSFQSLSNQGRTDDISKRHIEPLPVPSIEQASNICSVFKQLMGIDYDFNNPNAIDKWIFGLLRDAAQNNAPNLKSHLKLVHCLHPDNQMAIFVSVYNLAKQNESTLICDLLLNEKKDLKEWSNEIKFDLTKEEKPRFITTLATIPQFIPAKIALIASSIAWLVSFGYTVFDSSFRCTIYLSEGVHGSVHNGCLIKVNGDDTPLYMYEYFPTLVNIAGGCLLAGYLHKARQITREIRRTFDEFAQRFINNNELEKAIKLCKTQSSLISEKHVYRIGLKALEQGNIELAQRAAQTMTDKQSADKLYSQILSKVTEKP